ncbi:MAG: hypothetical protein M3178_05880 [Pseudomonadota bacterium]|nr:hypothetical protein [Pseudomonadota bacterium]
MVNKTQVRRCAQALGKRAKTDPIDAMVIAHFAAATKPDLRPLRTRRHNFSLVLSQDAARSSK